MKKGKSQAQRMKERAQSAEHEVAAKDQEIAKLREQLAARNPGPSSTTTPPGRGTPSQRNPASRPQWEDRSSQASIPEEAKGEEPDGDESDGDSGEGDGDLRGDGDGGDEDAGVRSDSEEEKQEDDDHDMHVMRQLLQDFRDQRLSPDDRQAMMQAAGGQFTELLTQHWKEDSTPPKWLWSLFQPVSTTPSAQVTQVNSPTARSSSRVAQNENNGGSSSPSLIFRQPSVPAEPSSPINPRNLNPEFSTPQQAQDSRTHRPSNPVALSTPLPRNNSMPQDTPSMSGTPSTYTPGSAHKFHFKQNDLPKEIVFSGKPGERDVIEVLTQYRARVILASVASTWPSG